MKCPDCGSKYIELKISQFPIIDLDKGKTVGWKVKRWKLCAECRKYLIRQRM